jgi:hypothetical protein
MAESPKALRPTPKTYQLLYAKSGNRCAFPGCPMAISDGLTLFGEAAHIKAENAGGPRYDPTQSSEERRHFENLILLCGVHHKCVDDDIESYPVERLQRIKRDHEAKSVQIDQDEIESVAALLYAGNATVMAINPYNSITAGTFHQTITNNFGTDAHQAAAQPYLGVLPKEGAGRFRPKGKPLGRSQSLMPFNLDPGSEVSMTAGPCFWFRMLPSQAHLAEWTFHELDLAAGGHTTPRLQTVRGFTEYRFTSKDGIGRYLSIGPGFAYSASMLFRTGEVWSIDTALCIELERKLFALSIVRKGLPNLVTQFAAILESLRIAPPFQWICGIEGAEGYNLAFDRRDGNSDFWYPPLLADSVIAKGLYSPRDDPSEIADKFSRKVFAECGIDQPSGII